MSQTSAFDKIRQVQEYKSQISRLIVDEIFEKLHQSAQQWIEFVHSNSRKRRRHTQYSCWHRLELFGSSAVGTSTECSDVDVNLIVPPLFTQENFFEGFPKFLKRNEFMDIYTVVNATVPLICFTYKNMEVDLCFTVLSHETCPTIIDLMRFPAEQYISKKKGFLVTQGLRVAYILKECFLSNCPRKHSKDSIQSKGSLRDVSGSFYQLGYISRKVLRCATLFVKSWAQKRGIYGNIFCYPGGVSWTIMIIYCFLTLKRINCMPIENSPDSLSEDSLSLLTRKFLTYFFIFYNVYFDHNRRSLPFEPRIHIYATHNIDLKENPPGIESADELLRRASISRKQIASEINHDNQDDDDAPDERAFVSKTFEMLLDRMQMRTAETPDQGVSRH
ncbi:Poly(A) polymerase [Perkinsela sp. CCAP 1560/4]|nr:Poly(A) polymerase [Perkinsela sp. CCAP 1560/4]|eukprot:KNH08735.1 Poly(A) polymerase [Perkinsela sp. CCAP 1560/4]